MKKVIKATIVLTLAVIVSNSSFAQKGPQVNLLYNISTPLGGDFKKFISKTAAASFQGSVLFGVTEKLKLGVQGAYVDYHQRKTATVINTIKTVPVLAKGEFTFVSKGMLKPFIGLGTGFNFVKVERDIAGVKNTSSHTQWGFTGDAGVLIGLSKTGKYGVRLSTSYNNLPLKKEGIQNLDSWNVQAGVSINL